MSGTTWLPEMSVWRATTAAVRGRGTGNARRKDARRTFLSTLSSRQSIKLASLSVHKLRNYRTIGKSNTWTQNFLTDRRKAFVVGGSRSDSIPVDSGVPKGSVLGPILFLLHTTDLLEGPTTRTCLFSDDTLCHKDIGNEQE